MSDRLHRCPTCTCDPKNSSDPARKPWRLPTKELAPRLWPAWLAATNLLDEAWLGANDGWASRHNLVITMTEASDITAKTAANTLRSAERIGALETKRGAGGSIWYRTADRQEESV